MQLVVESAGVAHSETLVVPPPEGRRCRVAISTGRLAASGRLQQMMIMVMMTMIKMIMLMMMMIDQYVNTVLLSLDGECANKLVIVVSQSTCGCEFLYMCECVCVRVCV